MSWMLDYTQNLETVEIVVDEPSLFRRVDFQQRRTAILRDDLISLFSVIGAKQILHFRGLKRLTLKLNFKKEEDVAR